MQHEKQETSNSLSLFIMRLFLHDSSLPLERFSMSFFCRLMMKRKSLTNLLKASSGKWKLKPAMKSFLFQMANLFMLNLLHIKTSIKLENEIKEH